jgi:geranylgeranyl diphosphate synthase type II
MIQTDVYKKPQSSLLLQQCEDEMLCKIEENEPSRFHLESGGNRTRAKLTIDAGLALQIPSKSVISLACCVELLHNASLVHDDLQDADDTRRGRESVWNKFGKAQAICAGDLMLSAAYGALADIGFHNTLPSLLTNTQQAVARTIQGQSLDLNAQANMTLQEYENIAAMKSGPLIQLSLTLPLIRAGHLKYVSSVNSALSKFAIVYQIVDDLEDWKQDLKTKQLNIVNLLAAKCPTSEAVSIAQNRAQHLLLQTKNELSVLPANCGLSFVEAANNLLLKAKSGLHE